MGTQRRSAAVSHTFQAAAWLFDSLTSSQNPRGGEKGGDRIGSMKLTEVEGSKAAPSIRMGAHHQSSSAGDGVLKGSGWRRVDRRALSGHLLLPPAVTSQGVRSARCSPHLGGVTGKLITSAVAAATGGKCFVKQVSNSVASLASGPMKGGGWREPIRLFWERPV